MPGESCLNPDYCGTGDAETVCASCRATPEPCAYADCAALAVTRVKVGEHEYAPLCRDHAARVGAVRDRLVPDHLQLFRLRADVIFAARDVDDALHQLSTHFRLLRAGLDSALIERGTLDVAPVAPRPCCERDFDADGNCDRHPHGVAHGG